MKTAILFTNYSDEDFSHSWDSVVYNFPKGQSTMLESMLGAHFARHLAVRELNKKDVITSKANINEEAQKAISTTSVEAEDDTKLAHEAQNYKKMNKLDLVKEAEDKGIDVKGKDKKDLVDELEGFEGE